ncbi:putative premnaspirodiene oxygenase [Dioscorea sansibarensis]
MAKEITKTHDHIFASRRALKAVRILHFRTRDIFWASYGEYWRQMRKITVTNLLNKRRVQSFHAARKKEAVLLIDKVVSHASSHPLQALNMSQVLFSFSNAILCRAILGEFSREQEGRNEMFMELIEENVILFSRVNLEDFFPSLGWLNFLLGLDGRVNRSFVRWDGVLSLLIKEHENKNGGNLKDDDFVDVFLSLKKDPKLGFCLNDEHIKALLLVWFLLRLEFNAILK